MAFKEALSGTGIVPHFSRARNLKPRLLQHNNGRSLGDRGSWSTVRVNESMQLCRIAVTVKTQ